MVVVDEAVIKVLISVLLVVRVAMMMMMMVKVRLAGAAGTYST